MALDRGQGRRCRLFYGKESWLEGAESLLRPSLNERRGTMVGGVGGWRRSAVGENDSKKLGSMRKESVKLLELFSKN